jgi:hypothetical protein
LKGSGLILLHDEALWDVLDGWVASLSADAVLPVLPLVRRTFSSFAAPERRQMGERARRGSLKKATTTTASDLDLDRAEAVLPLVAKLLGIAIDPKTLPAGEPKP